LIVTDHTKNTDDVRRYHQRTKHRLERYANGPETLDWTMQPNPFRYFEGTEKIQLPLSAQKLETGYCDLYAPGTIPSHELNVEAIGALLKLSMGLSAWKEYMGDRWALRCNPSSGNLHPTEAYVIATGLRDLNSGVYHYVSHDHILEQRCMFADAVAEATNANTEPLLLVGLSSIFWREAWKYGERAFRYCQLDVGHALGAIRYACAALGWSVEPVTIADDDLEKLLGLDRDQDFGNAEREHPDLLIRIVTGNADSDTLHIEQIMQQCLQARWAGSANILDKHHMYKWPIINEVAHATTTVKDSTSPQQWTPTVVAPPLPCRTTLKASDIIQRRRSAQMFDGQTAMEATDFFRMLDMLVPRASTPPWDALPWRPHIHLVLFVHRISGLEQGLYIMPRNEQALETLKATLSDKMQWQQVSSAPAHLNLFQLVKANSQKAAARLSCHQRIASDSAFSLGMLSEFDAALNAGPWAYKKLYWEAGLLGQILYLEAEANDLQGTGIGCFFDDAVHELLGINDTQFQSLYHFTVGGALNDSRLRTMMPYEHLRREPTP
jgi:SagB-type dehydrogenase family enzyme